MSYTVVVLGGGVAGLAVSGQLIQEETISSVVVVEKTNCQHLRIGEHLPPGTTPILRQLGMPVPSKNWPHFECPGVRSSWGSDAFEEKSYICYPNDTSWNLSRPTFDISLVEHARANGVTVETDTTIENIQQQSRHWQMTLKRNSLRWSLKADFLVDATGRSAYLSRMMKQTPIVYDQMIALIGIGTKPSLHAIPELLIEATETGWWYVARLADSRQIAAYMTDKDLLATSKHPKEAWSFLWQMSNVRSLCPDLTEHHAEIHIRSARSQFVPEAFGHRWLAVGDAASCYDPLSSQGIQKALYEGTQAAPAIARSLQLDQIDPLEAYYQSIRNRFSGYLAMRYQMYGIESRWADAPFWQRRKAPYNPGHIWLSPHSILQMHTRAKAGEVIQKMAWFEPSIEGKILFAVSQKATPSHQLVRNYQSLAKHPSKDERLIHTLQFLIEEGDLRRQPQQANSS